MSQWIRRLGAAIVGIIFLFVCADCWAKKPSAEGLQMVRMEATGYCVCKACCGPRARGVTADGTKAVGKMIAAPSKYSFGTVMTVPGYGRAVVHDRGGAIQAAGVKLKPGMTVGSTPVPVRKLRYDRIDLLFPSHKEALAWGRRFVDVQVQRK